MGMENNNLPKWLQDWDRNFAKAQADQDRQVAELAAINTRLDAIELELMEEEMDSALDHLILWDISCKLADIKEAEAAIQLKIKAIKEA
jgi:hypothetical protein